MRVGIDARFLTHPQRGGFKSYTNQVITALSKTPGNNEYIVYTDRPSERDPGLPGSFTVVPVDGANALLREQISLPRRMLRDGIELAHYPCNTAPIALGPRMVVTIHDAIPLRKAGAHLPSGAKQRMLRLYWRSVMPRCADRASMVITDSGFTQGDLMGNMGLPADKIRVVPLFVDPAFASGEVSPPDVLPTDGEYLLAFASADGRKNHLRAIAAYRALAPEYPRLRLALVCSHPSVRASLSGNPSSGVDAVGPVTTSELVWLYRHATALVFPSFEEGFGLPPLEAMTCGIPVAASNTSSIPEVLGSAGEYFDPLQVESITQAVRRLLSDDSLRQQMVRRGLERSAMFVPERMGEQLLRVYADALSGGRV